MQKILAIVAAGSIAAGAAFAGGMTEPIMEEEVVEEEATSSSRAGILVPILAILLIGLAMSNRNDGGGTTEGGA